MPVKALKISEKQETEKDPEPTVKDWIRISNTGCGREKQVFF
jgi:hypothetical protein